MRSPALVLMGHDVHDEARSTRDAGLSASPALLAEVIEALRSRGYRFLGLRDWLDQRAREQVALLTFDDGYARLRSRALPVLRELRVPALVFLIASSLRQAHDPFPLWLFELRDRALLQPAKSSEELEARPELQLVVQRAGAQSLAALLTGPENRVYRAFRRALSADSLDRLGAALAAQGSVARSVLESEEIRELQGSGWFELGAHSMRHHPLTQLPAAQVREEVEGSLQALSEWTGLPTRELAFSYPYGAATPSACRSVARRAAAGFGTSARRVSRLDPSWLLPRLSLDASTLESLDRPEPLGAALAPLRERLVLQLRPWAAALRRATR